MIIIQLGCDMGLKWWYEPYSKITMKIESTDKLKLNFLLSFDCSIWLLVLILTKPEKQALLRSIVKFHLESAEKLNFFVQFWS